jgi:type 1 glutamine amidotransferase
MIKYPPIPLLIGLLFLPFFAHAQETSITYHGKEGPGKGKHVVFLTGDEEYRSEEGLPMMAKILSQRHGFECTVLFSAKPDGTIDPNDTTLLPGSEALDSADAIFMLLRFRNWPEEAIARFEKAYLAGKPIIGLRTSTHAFKGNRLEHFGKTALGEQWVSHWGKHKSEATLAVVEPSSKDDPLLTSVGDIFCLTDVYEAYPAPDAKILFRGEVLKGLTPDSGPADYVKPRATDKKEQKVNDPMMPIVWTREYKNPAGNTNRILCTTTGAATDLESESLRRLLVNAVYWGVGLEVPTKAEVTYVDPYDPSFYGFNGYRKGMKVSDLDLGKALPGQPLAKPASAKQ